MMAKLRIHSPAGDFQFSHRPANAIRPPVAERDRVRLLSGRGLRPFIKVIDRHEATPQSGRTAGVSENRQSGEIRTSVPARKSCSVPSGLTPRLDVSCLVALPFPRDLIERSTRADGGNKENSGSTPCAAPKHVQAAENRCAPSARAERRLSRAIAGSAIFWIL